MTSEFWDPKAMRDRSLDFDRWLESPATDAEPDDDWETKAREAFEEAEERRVEEHLERETERRYGVYD